MMTNKSKIIASMIALFPIILGGILYNRLPDRMPVHWNIVGQPDWYVDKLWAILLIPVIVLSVICFLWFAETRLRNRILRLSMLLF